MSSGVRPFLQIDPFFVAVISVATLVACKTGQGTKTPAGVWWTWTRSWGRLVCVAFCARAAQGQADSLLTLLAMEEQTRNSSFVAAMQTQSLSRSLQSKALRAYSMLCDNVLNKLTRRLP